MSTAPLKRSTVSTLPLKAGALTLLCPGLMSSWKLRYFVLFRSELAWWKDEKDFENKKKPEGEIKINNRDIKCHSSSPSSLEFQIVSPSQSLTLRSTLQQKKDWYDALDDVGGASVGRPASPAYSRSRAPYHNDDEDMFMTHRERDVQDISEVEATQQDDDANTADQNTTPAAAAATTATNERSTSNADKEKEETKESEVAPVKFDRKLSDKSAASSVPSISRKSSESVSKRSSSNAVAPTSPSMKSSTLSSQEMADKLKRRAQHSTNAATLFAWSPKEQVIKSYSCALEKTIMLHGRLYITQHYLGFYSNIFSPLKVVVPISDILSVVEANQALIFPNAIKVFVKGDSNALFFGSFAPGARSKTLQLLNSLVDTTFNPADYYMQKDSNTDADSDGYDSADGDADGEDDKAAATNESADAAENTSIPNLLRLSTHLDFAELRPSPEVVCSDKSDIDLRQHVNTFIPGFTLSMFWNVFWRDDALWSMSDFHKKRGDNEYNCSIWKSADSVDGASSLGWQQVRDTTVRVPVLNSPIGPDSTRVLKVQKKKLNNNQLIIETIAITPDVPFGNCFYLVDIWKVEEQSVDGKSGIQLTIDFGVRFTKETWKMKAFKSTIVNRTHDENKKCFENWVEWANAFIKTHVKEIDHLKKQEKSTLKKHTSSIDANNTDNNNNNAASTTNTNTASPTATTTSSTTSSPAATATKSLSSYLPPSITPPMLFGALGLLVLAVAYMLPWPKISLSFIFTMAVYFILIGTSSMSVIKFLKLEKDVKLLQDELNRVKQQLANQKK